MWYHPITHIPKSYWSVEVRNGDDDYFVYDEADVGSNVNSDESQWNKNDEHLL